jgi:hypothetical protein
MLRLLEVGIGLAGRANHGTGGLDLHPCRSGSGCKFDLTKCNAWVNSATVSVLRGEERDDTATGARGCRRWQTGLTLQNPRTVIYS